MLSESRSVGPRVQRNFHLIILGEGRASSALPSVLLHLLDFRSCQLTSKLLLCDSRPCSLFSCS